MSRAVTALLLDTRWRGSASGSGLDVRWSSAAGRIAVLERSGRCRSAVFCLPTEVAVPARRVVQAAGLSYGIPPSHDFDQVVQGLWYALRRGLSDARQRGVPEVLINIALGHLAEAVIAGLDAMSLSALGVDHG